MTVIATCPECPVHFEVSRLLDEDRCPECGADWSDVTLAREADL